MSKLDDIMDNNLNADSETFNTDRAKEQIKDLIMELIGENDDVTVTDDHKSPSKYRKGKNYLRAELREKVEKL